MNDSQLVVHSLENSRPLQASKWLKIPVLIDEKEMRALFLELGDFFIYLISGTSRRGEGLIERESFLGVYSDYVQALRQGQVPLEAKYRLIFSSVFTVSCDALYAVYVAEDLQLIKIAKPVVQLQPHRIGYSSLDGQFRSMILGPESVTWGIQFSYPQIYQDPESKQVEQVKEGKACPNTPLFRCLQRWVRHNTVPVPFSVDGKKINVPIRLGKNCCEWINQHPQLVKQGLKIDF